ncbi:hypothetical protein BDD12DRAFT_857501 [Trichophaea hybrida]|nr:hypothetical protein BDD12DRAFT_857501 [Trichophaea hybrida]
MRWMGWMQWMQWMHRRSGRGGIDLILLSMLQSVARAVINAVNSVNLAFAVLSEMTLDALCSTFLQTQKIFQVERDVETCQRPLCGF